MKVEEHGARKRADLIAADDLLAVAAPIDASACKEGWEEREGGRVSGEGGGGWGGRWEGDWRDCQSQTRPRPESAHPTYGTIIPLTQGRSTNRDRRGHHGDGEEEHGDDDEVLVLLEPSASSHYSHAAMTGLERRFSHQPSSACPRLCAVYS